MKYVLKINKLIGLRLLFTTSLPLLLLLPAMAQREKGESLITQDQTKKITEVVKPLIDQFTKQLSGDETYKAYMQDVTALNDTKSIGEKKALSQKLKEKYTAFFQKVWASADVDEKSFQLRIRRVFPDDLAKLIQFEPFLVFTMSVSTFTGTRPSEPPPPDKCVDICPIAAGEITGSGALIAGSGGSYGNCF